MANNIAPVASETVATYTGYKTANATKKEDKVDKADKVASKESEAAVYEKSEKSSSGTYTINKMSAEDRSALVKQLKQDQVDRQQQLTNLVQQMLTKQSGTFSIATADGKQDEDGIWKFLASGEYTVDAETKAQAQKDIAEDGYYGVKQTSERLFDFASALAGDDVEKMQKMQKAVMSGFKEATKAWGKDLPDICKDTLDATNKLFEDYYASKKSVEE